MKRITLALLFALTSTTCAAQLLKWHPYSSSDITRQAVFTGLMLLDYKQTLDIKKHKELRETNKILGENPSDTRVRNYFIATTIVHAAIVGFLPPAEREVWQCAGIVLEGVVVMHNRRLGLHISF